MTLEILSNFMKERPRASSNNLIITIVVSRDAYARPRAGVDKIGTYLEAGNHVSKLYAPNENTKKAASEHSRLGKMPSKSAVQFADAAYHKAVRCGNAYPDERI